MTEAQAKRTRLKVWQDFLTACGGTPRTNDTLYQTIRKTLVALGGTPTVGIPLLRLAKGILDASGGTSRANDTLYQTIRKLGLILDPTIGCCQLPPLQALLGTSPPSSWQFGNPDEGWVFGDPNTGVVFGQP